jgi:hypothetical protein
LETYTEPKKLVENPHYQEQRRQSLAGLSDDMIDAPIVDVINGFNKLPYCFTMQSCYGHFIYNNQKDAYNLEPLPITDDVATVEYRIAYLCLCIQNSALGSGLLEALNEITAIDPQNVQLCCAEWFWERQVNSYALQVEPDRFKHRDTAILDYREAVHIEKIRNEFFIQLRELIRKQRRL